MPRILVIAFLFLSASCGFTDDTAIGDTVSPEEVAAANSKPADGASSAELELTEAVRDVFRNGPRGDGWPALTEFEGRWRSGIGTYHLVHCEQTTLRTNENETFSFGPVMLMHHANGWNTVADSGDREERWLLYPQTWALAGDLNGDEVTVWNHDRRLECHGARVEEVKPVAETFAPYVYSLTLNTPPEPLRIHNDDELDEEGRARVEELRQQGWTEANIQELISLAVSSRDDVWGEALAWANTEGRDDLAYEIYRRYRPFGRCSRDTRPLTLKKEYADLCDRLERPRCHLALTTELLAYRVSRRTDMWVGGKPVSYENELDRLPEGIDVTTYMAGLLVDYPGTEGNESASISPHFFALATAGTEYAEVLNRHLEEGIANPNVDSWNRHRFALALLSLRVRTAPDEPVDAMAQEIAELDGVPRVTRLQLQSTKAR